MDWDRLRTFYVVSEAGSFTRAGERLNLTQSAISRQILALENDLGVILFTRHVRGLVATAEGEILFKTVHSIYTQLNTTTAQLAEAQGSLKGILKFSTSVAFGSVWFSKRVHEFNRRYPDINLEINLTDDEVNFTMREADVAVRFGPINQPNLIKYPLMISPLRIYAHQSYLNEFGTPNKVNDLDNHRLIVFGTYSPPPIENVNWLLHVGARPGHVREPFLTINNAFGIVQAVQNGVGIAALAEFIARDYSALTPILSHLKGPEINASLVYPEQMENSERIRVLKDFLVEKLATRP